MTSPSPRQFDRFVRPIGGRGFTLAELLVTMGIIAVVATVTIVAIRGISRDARLASAKNTLVASLNTARALAMKNNQVVMVVFRPRLDGEDQYVEIVFAEWTGESARHPGSPFFDWVIDRFVPIADVPSRQFPAGINVAAPGYFDSVSQGYTDTFWVTQPYLPNAGDAGGEGEKRGEMIAVMFAPDGATINRNSYSDSNQAFVDFNNDQQQRQYGTDYDYSGPGGYPDWDFFWQKFEDDESFILPAPFVSVYDDEAAREIRALNWSNEDQYRNELLDRDGFINQFGERIHFNRYSGVVMQ